MNIIFESKAFGAIRQPAIPADRKEIRRMEWSMLGGPSYAEIDISGPYLTIWQLMQLIRCGVSIYQSGGEKLWWGYVHEILITDGAFEMGISMDRVMNRVMITYSRVDANGDIIGEPKDTEWAEAAESIATYGKKEYIGKIQKTTKVIAEQRRDILLEKYSKPNQVSRKLISSLIKNGINNKQFGKNVNKNAKATLKCRGWWDTLNWRYVSQPPIDGMYYQDWDDLVTQQMGRSTYKPIIQQFTTGARAVTVREVTLSMSRIGLPTDNVVIQITALNASGNPTGAAIDEITFAGSDLYPTYLPNAGTLITKTFSSGADLAAGTQYGLVISRSGAMDANKYYIIAVKDVNGYAGGVFKRYNTGTSSWDAPANRDMPFILRVDNEVGTARQIDDLITEYAQFITDVIYTDTGLEQSSYQDGKTTCMEEVMQLMETGGVNGRQLLAKIDQSRRMLVFEEPDPNLGGAYLLSKFGKLLYLSGAEVKSEFWRVPGNYVRMKDVLPMIQAPGENGAGIQFIEELHWTPKDGIRPIFRGQVRPEDLLRTEVK